LRPVPLSKMCSGWAREGLGHRWIVPEQVCSLVDYLAPGHQHRRGLRRWAGKGGRQNAVDGSV